MIRTCAGRSSASCGRSNRAGVVTVLCLVTLLIFAGLIGQYVRRVILERRQFRQEIRYEQTEKLAEGGLVMAEQLLKKDQAWKGANWTMQVGEIHQTKSATIDIRVEGQVCTVVARYPADSEIPFQVTKTRKLTQ